jgi:hypothetical protein
MQQRGARVIRYNNITQFKRSPSGHLQDRSEHNVDKLLTTLLIVFSIFTSGLASLVVFNFLERRDRKIRERIEELETEEDYLKRIYFDDGKLNRSTYVVILMALCVSFIALALVMAAFAFGISTASMRYIYLIAAWLFMVSAGMCFYHFRSIMRIDDFERTRESFRQRKLRLEDRLR